MSTQPVPFTAADVATVAKSGRFTRTELAEVAKRAGKPFLEITWQDLERLRAESKRDLAAAWGKAVTVRADLDRSARSHR